MQHIINMKYIIVTLISITLLQIDLSGQRGFKGSLVAGLNLSQIDGDNLVGFRRAGLSTGIKVSFQLKRKLYGNVELLYSQRGSGPKLFSGTGAVTQLNYFELPVYISINDWYIEKDNYHKLSGDIGLSLGNLFSASVSEEITEFNPDTFETTDISYLLGANYAFTKNLSITVRYTRSFTKLLNDPAIFDKFLLSYFWTVRTEYTF